MKWFIENDKEYQKCKEADIAPYTLNQDKIAWSRSQVGQLRA